MRIIINGSSGFMGRVLAAMAKVADDCEVVAGIDKFTPEVAPEFPVFPTFAECSVAADVIIDFSRPDALDDILAYAVKNNVRVVIATTGLTEEHYAKAAQAAKSIPVFIGANMSLGVNLQMDLIQRTAAFLGDEFDVEIIEKHHNRKVDAPSGTALQLAKALQGEYPAGRTFMYGRTPASGKRQPNEIGIHAVRGGTIVGEHQVHFIGNDEIVEIRHAALSRQVFATGALRAARFILRRPPRVYTMDDIVASLSAVTTIYKEHDQSIVTLLQLPTSGEGIAGIFHAVAKGKINLDMISQTAPEDGKVNVSFTLPRENLPQALELLAPLAQSMGFDMRERSDIGKVTVVGLGMEYRHGIAARAFGALSAAGIELLLVTTSETDISCCVAIDRLDAAYDALRKEFELD